VPDLRSGGIRHNLTPDDDDDDDDKFLSLSLCLSLCLSVCLQVHAGIAAPVEATAAAVTQERKLSRTAGHRHAVMRL